MEYVRLGRTGLKVSRLILGCMTYGDPKWSPWVLDEAASRPFIRRALDLGVNTFDTADMYSAGASEEILGRALKEWTTRQHMVIATKLYNPMGPEPNNRGLSRKHIFEAVDASLRRLQTDYIDLTRSIGSTMTRRSKRHWMRSMMLCAPGECVTSARPRCLPGSS